MKKNIGIGVVLVVLLTVMPAFAGGGIAPVVPLDVEGWWEVNLFGLSLTQNKERGVVTEEVWIYAKPLACQDTWCQASFRIFKMDKGWREVGSGNLDFPSAGNNLWFYYSSEIGNYYGSIFHFGNEMEGGFVSDKWECAGDCTLTSRSCGRITFKR